MMELYTQGRKSNNMNQRKIKQIRNYMDIPVGYKRKYYRDEKTGTIHADQTRKEYQRLKKAAYKTP